jgi:hypothetical protein
MAVLSSATNVRRDPRRCGRRAALSWIVSCVVVFVTLAASPAALAQAAGQEYQVKAVFLFNFVQFVEWPSTAFSSPEAPFRIGVLGDDPFAGALEAAVQGETVRQRALVIERASRIEALLGCHVVFVARSERALVGPILAATLGKPILTVGDMPDFARGGGIINFYLEGNKVRFEINRAAAQGNGLKLSSQLLGLARIVGPSTEGGRRP